MKTDYFEPIIKREATRLNKHLDRAKEKGCESSLTLERWLQICAVFNWRCAFCKSVVIGMEHLRPIWQGGGTVAGNCVPCCSECNNRNNTVLMQLDAAKKRLLEVTE